MTIGGVCVDVSVCVCVCWVELDGCVCCCVESKVESIVNNDDLDGVKRVPSSVVAISS